MQKLLDSLLETVPLSDLPRTGWIQAGLGHRESVAAHSHGVALVALALAPRVEPALDVDRAVTLAAVHDLGEARLGDLPRSAAPWLARGAKAAAEAAAGEDLARGLSGVAGERFLEAAARTTREARFAALCDKLQLGLFLLGLERAGARGPASFWEGLEGLDCAEFPPCAAFRDALLARRPACG